MSSLEGNKIAAAVLVGGMITLTVGIATDFIYRPHHGAQAAHEGGEPAAPAKSAPVEAASAVKLSAKDDTADSHNSSAKCTD